MPDDLDNFKSEFYDALKDIYERLKAHEGEVGVKLGAVTKAVTMLSQELFAFQKQRNELYETDRLDRAKRQKWQDIKDAVVGCFVGLVLLTGCGILAVLVYLLIQGRL
jgi:uncharacterized BrkB/YihY/UPF0761 family membrane protein